MNKTETKPKGVEVVVRAVIADSMHEKILMCSPKSKEYFYLPGGHIEPGETAAQALKRELAEELGMETNLLSYTLIGASENIFSQNGEKHHEINLYFFIPDIFSEAADVLSREPEILFSWVSVKEISTFRILPVSAQAMCGNMIFPEHIFSWNGVSLSKQSAS